MALPPVQSPPGDCWLAASLLVFRWDVKPYLMHGLCEGAFLAWWQCLSPWGMLWCHGHFSGTPAPASLCLPHAASPLPFCPPH